MKVLILYRPNSEHERQVVDYVRDYKMRSGRELETMSLDTREGAHKAKLYGVTNYPALLALSDDGRLHKLWQEGHMPLMDEIAYYDRDNLAEATTDAVE